MNTREWALVAFTLLMQASVGVLLVVAALHPFVSRGSMHGPPRPFDTPLLVAACAAVAAMAASLAHLGHPMQAWLAVGNVRTSWLSREVVIAAVFTALAVAHTLLERTGGSSPVLRAVVLGAAALAGLAVVFTMSRLYMVPAQPAWDRLLTPLAFFTTALLLGSLVVAVAMRPPTPGIERALTGLAIGLLAIQLLLLPAQMSAVVSEPATAVSSAAAMHLAGWLAAGRALAAVAAVVLLAPLLRNGAAPSVAPAIGAFVLVLVSEVCGRVLFYASSVRL